MPAKKGLGKGLGALITQAAKEDDTPLSPAFMLDINKIEPNPAQPRKHFDKEALTELAQSVKEHGILQPIIVTKGENDRYYIVAGERRWRAARLAKLSEAPVIIREFTDAQSLQVALIENLQREDINPIEEALSYKRLIDEFFFRQEDIALKVGKSQSRVSACLSLLSLSEKVQALLTEGKLNAASARVLLQIKEKDVQEAAALKIAEGNMTAEEADKYIKTLGVQKKSAEKPQRAPVFEHIERDLNHILGTKVRIRETKKGGKIQIEYSGSDELDRIIGIFKLNKGL